MNMLEELDNNNITNRTDVEYTGIPDCLYEKPVELVVQEWPLVNLPCTIVIVTAYVIFCKFIGPWFMQHRQPYELKTAMQAYNLLQVYISWWLLTEFLRNGWGGHYNFICQPIDRSPRGYAMAETAWWCFMSKFFEFLDTIFFVFRKKNKQITMLHLVHHSLMPLLLAYGMPQTPNGHGTFGGPINAFVHMIMYSYYFLSTLGQSVQKYLWWKVYLTKLQLLQFALVILHQMLIFAYDCNFPKKIAMIESGLCFLFTVLFFNFYIQSYIKGKRLGQKPKVKAA